MTTITALGRDRMASTSFLALLHEAAEVDDTELRRIRDGELTHLSVIGIIEHARVIAFAAWAEQPDRLVLEYIAVEAAHRGRRLGAALIGHIGQSARAIYAETDDDAVEFYRTLGFSVSEIGRDARWPDRRRYGCTLESGTTVRSRGL